MAGRKPSSESGFFSTLLGKLGFEPAEPPKAKKGKRRRKARKAEGEAGYGPEAGFDAGPEAGEASPFAAYGQSGGLMEPATGEFADTLSYEAAAAAGFAPPVAPGPEAPAAPALPQFGLPAPAPVTPLTPPAPAAQPPAPGGKLFSADALDTSLDALFSGLETGMGTPPLPPTVETPAPVAPAAEEKPLFDEFGLTPAKPVAEAPAPEPAPAPAPEPVHAPVVIHKPIVAEPEPEPAPQLAPPAPMMAPSTEAFRMPAPTVLALAEGVDLRSFLAAIDRVAGVAGSLIVGYDGLLIAATTPPEIDRDYLGAQACNLFMGNRGQLDKMRRGELRRILLETASGAMLVTSADMGILVVVSHEGRAMDVGGVMAAIGTALGR